MDKYDPESQQVEQAEHNRIKSLEEAERRAAKLAAGPVLIDVKAAMERCFNAGNHGNDNKIVGDKDPYR